MANGASTRRVLLAAVLWMYGISISVTLVSLWGRAVVADQSLLAAGAGDAAGSDLVSQRIESWLVGELNDVPGVERPVAEQAASAVVADPDLTSTMDRLVGQIVLAAAAPVGRPATVDVAGALQPAVPTITRALSGAGMSVSDSQVASVVGNLDPLVVREPDSPPIVGRGSRAASALSLATALGVAAAAATGVAAVRLSEDRRKMVKDLLIRIAISALGFAVMFRLGAWILDPGAGRSPVRMALARVVAAKLWLPLILSGAAALAAWLLRTRSQRAGVVRAR
jgi:hypothetical protein